jgi:hypothetical protein
MVNPGFRGRRGGSYAWAGMTSRVVLTGARVWSSSVCLFEGLDDGRALVAQETM